VTCFGTDGSYHQFGGRFGQNNPASWLALTDADWNAVGFVKWRASIATRTDWSFPRMRTAAQARGKPFAAYHFPYPTSRYTARAQVDALMLSLAGDTDIPVWIDWEHDGPSVVPLWNDVLRFADEARSRGLRVPGIYTGGWYWSGWAGSPRLSGYGLDLWLSSYGSNAPGSAQLRYDLLGGDGSGVWQRNIGGLTPVTWQFGSQIRWGNRLMDHNAHRGPVELLGRYFWTPTPPAPPAPPPLPKETNVMLPMIVKYPNHGSWAYSLDGGETHRRVGGARASALVAGGAINAKDAVVVTSWSPVQDCASNAEVAALVGQLVD
jgi:hypothetical protein